MYGDVACIRAKPKKRTHTRVPNPSQSDVWMTIRPTEVQKYSHSRSAIPLMPSAAIANIGNLSRAC